MGTKAPSLIRFTASRAATLPVGTHTDPAQPGLQLRVRETRRGLKRSWLLRFKFKGEETRILLGHFPPMTLESARKAAQTFREDADRGIDPRKAGPRRKAVHTPVPVSSGVSTEYKHSIENLAHEFMEYHVKLNRDRPEQVQAILDKDVLSTWRGRDSRTIKRREVIELLDGIVARGSRVMANRTAAILGQMFNVGLDRELLDASPVRVGYRPGGEESSRARVLTDAELSIFLKDPTACTRQPRLAYVIELLLLTAVRRGELVSARWQDVDLQKKLWQIPPEDTKTDRELVVPLSDRAVEIFNRLKKRAGKSLWVLPGSDPSKPLDPKLMTRGLAKCRKRFGKEGIKPFVLHDLRRTCRTGLSRLGIAPHVGERVLNHSIGQMQDVYDKHDYLDERRAAMDKWAAHLQSLAQSTLRARVDHG